MVATLQQASWTIKGYENTNTHRTKAADLRHDLPLAFDNRLENKADEELVGSMAHGSTQALEELYNRHVRNCYGLAMKIVRDPHLAEEVVQDVFVKLWSKPSSFIPDRGKFVGWLMTLVHNRSVDKLRRANAQSTVATITLDFENRHGVALADVLPDESPSPDDLAWAREQGDVIRDALRRLPEPQRQAISLAYFGGLTQKEVAERLQEPLGTIKTRTRTGLQQLRRLLVGADLE